MAAEVKAPEIEYRIVTDAEEARSIDPTGVPWGSGNVIIFAIESGVVVGRSAAVAFPMIESTWVAESKRGTSLAVRLVRKVEEIQRGLGNAYVFAFAQNEKPEIGQYLLRDGYEEAPLKLYMKKLVDEK